MTVGEPTVRAAGRRRGGRDRGIAAALVVVDALLLALALYASWAIRYVAEVGPEIEEANSVPFAVFAPLLLALVPASLLTFAAGGLYRRRRGTEWFDDIPGVAKGTALATMALFAG